MKLPPENSADYPQQKNYRFRHMKSRSTFPRKHWTFLDGRGENLVGSLFADLAAIVWDDWRVPCCRVSGFVSL
jgi:hypothetical protein